MSPSLPPTGLASRLSALAQRLGLGGRLPRQLFERARQVNLPYRALPATPDTIWWQHGPALHLLPDLPRDALSGPVQEDKALARAVLMNVVQRERQTLESFDLRQIDGLCGLPASPSEGELNGFEALASGPLGRSARIISYKDFLKTISQVLPRFLAGAPVELRQATWHGDRVFWAGEQQGETFACAIVYARLRGLEVCLPAELTRYRLNSEGLLNLRQQYHMLAMPVQAWSEPAFMSLLLDNGLPYARLALWRYPGAPEFLLLPKSSELAHAIGEGLRLAGAPDVIRYLEALQQSAAN